MKNEQNMQSEVSNAAAEEATESPSQKKVLAGAGELFRKVFSQNNIPYLYAFVAILSISYGAYEINYFSHVGISDGESLRYLSTVILVGSYATMFVFSAAYTMKLREQFKEKYERYRKRTDTIPKILSVWVLPIITVLLVMAAQVITVQGVQDPISTVGSISFPAREVIQEDYVSNSMAIPYHLAFSWSASVMLLMIGMELSYSAQEHRSEHLWFILVVTSLILDFVSYFVLVAGLKAPSSPGSVHEMKAVYTSALGLASLASSYFTVTQARICDEVLRSDDGGGDRNE